MGIFKIIRHTDGGYDYLNHAVKYVLYGKAPFDCVGSPNTSLEYPLEQMHYVKQYYDKRSTNPLFHFILVYTPRTAHDVEQAKSITRTIAGYFAPRYQIIWCVHEKHMSTKYNAASSLYHAHLVINSVSFVDGRMFSGDCSCCYSFLGFVKSVTRDKNWKIVFSTDKDSGCEIQDDDQ